MGRTTRRGRNPIAAARSSESRIAAVMRPAIRIAYRCAAVLRRLYWLAFRPTTPGVKCIVEHDGKLLFIKNSYGRRLWTFPGGACHRGEDPAQAAQREVAEEVGINVTQVRAIGSFYSDREYKRDTVHCFHASVASPVHRVDGTEVTEAAWFAPDALPERRSRTVASALRLMSKGPET